MRGSDLLKGIVLAVAVAVPAMAEPARRVVSMNLCTDQLAMLVAGDGQLVSVSDLALDPRGSAMAQEAKAFATNRGLAEEIYLMRPDLVVAGSFSARTTIDMLKRLGVKVAVFDPAYSFEDVAERVTQMGAVLGRETRAAEIVATYRTDLAALRNVAGNRPTAALYSANGYTSGDRSLAGQILIAAGFTNVATQAGYPDGGVMPLEVLAMAAPEAVLTSHPYPGASRSEDIMAHPVVQSLRKGATSGRFTDRDWVCGTPFVLRAVAQMVHLRQDMRPVSPPKGLQ